MPPATGVRWWKMRSANEALIHWPESQLFALFPVPLLGQLWDSSLWTTGDEAADRQLTIRQKEAARKRRYRERIRQDPQLYRLYREKDHIYSRRYRDKLKKQRNVWISQCTVVCRGRTQHNHRTQFEHTGHIENNLEVEIHSSKRIH